MVTIDTTHDDALREVPFARETIYDGHILHVEKWRVTCPNGREAPREIVVHKGAAAVVPVFDNGDTLLVRQHRVAVDRVTLEIPAGHALSPDERPLDVAARKLREEAGFEAERFSQFSRFINTPSFSNQHTALFLATGLTPSDRSKLGPETPRAEVRLFSLDEAYDMVINGTIVDAKTIIAILRLHCGPDNLAEGLNE